MQLSPYEQFNIANEQSIQNYIKDNLYDPWVGTPYEGYRYLDNKQKGNFGEMIVSRIFESAGYDVEITKSSTSEFDRIINGIKTEIKFSLAHTDHKAKFIKNDHFTMNHVAVGKNWERLIFIGVNIDGSEFRSKYMTKKMFVNALKTGKYFSIQQGGQKGGNDDYMIASSRLRNLIDSKYMKDLSEW